MSGVPEERGRMHDFRLRLGQSLLFPYDPTRNLGPAVSVSMILNSGSKTTSKMKLWRTMCSSGLHAEEISSFYPHSSNRTVPANQPMLCAKGAG